MACACNLPAPGSSVQSKLAGVEHSYSFIRQSQEHPKHLATDDNGGLVSALRNSQSAKAEQPHDMAW